MRQGVGVIGLGVLPTGEEGVVGGPQDIQNPCPGDQLAGRGREAGAALEGVGQLEVLGREEVDEEGTDVYTAGSYSRLNTDGQSVALRADRQGAAEHGPSTTPAPPAPPCA
jgi:hypothetical protein